MVIISKSTLSQYSNKYPAAATVLNAWYEIVRKQDWKQFADIKQTFNSVDGVGNDRFVFNIKGNEYRLIVLILFGTRTAFILWFGNHVEYDKLNKHTGASNVQYEK